MIYDMPPVLQGTPQQQLQEILDCANACGSLTTTKTGAIPALPTADEIEQCRLTVPYIGE